MLGDVPPGWAVSTIGEIAAVTMGQSPPSTVVNEEGEGLPFIQGNAEFGARYPTPRQFAADCPKVAHDGDILLSVRAPVGEVNIAAGKLCIGRGLAALRPVEGDPDFLYFSLRGLAPAFARLSQGSTFDAINGKDLRSISVAVPPLDEQRRIAEVLRSVDEAIAAADRALGQAVKIARDVMIAQLVLPRAAKDPLPNGWKCVPIGSIGKVQAGRQRAPSFTRGSVRPYLRVANVFDGFIDTSDVLEMPFTDREYAEYRLLPGDILLNEGQSIELVGRAARHDGDPADCCFQNTLVRLRATTVNPDYAYALIRTMYAAGRFSEIASRTTSVAHLGVSRFAALLAPVPPVAEQVAIAELFGSLERTVGQQRASLTVLQAKRVGLMSDLLSGRVRVPA